MKTVKRNKWTSLSQWSHWISSQEWIQPLKINRLNFNDLLKWLTYAFWCLNLIRIWPYLVQVMKALVFEWINEGVFHLVDVLCVERVFQLYQELVHRDVIDVDSWILCEHRQRDGSTMFWKSPAWASSHYEARTSFEFPDNPWKEGTDFISLNIHFKQKWTHLLLVNVLLVVQSFDLNLFVPESSSTNSLWPSWSV